MADEPVPAIEKILDDVHGTRRRSPLHSEGRGRELESRWVRPIKTSEVLASSVPALPAMVFNRAFAAAMA
jgi:hypothetical protein